MAEPANIEFPVAKAKQIVHDLFKPDPLIYWADFLFYDILGWVAFVLAVKAPNFSLFQFEALIVAGFSLYRAILFVHELSHLKNGTFQTFHLAWNLICGFPLMIPSFLYVGVHIDHHKQRFYGTKNDPEYFAFALAKPYRIPLFPLTMLIAPTLFILRFLLLAPLSYLVPPIRKPLWVLGSHLAVGGPYRRLLPDEPEELEGRIQEAVTFLYVLAGFTLMAKGILPWKTLAVWYLIAVFILVTNALRSLVAHCDRNPPDHIMTFEEQFMDSTNIPGNPLLTPLWAPVGLRFHALHHLFVGIPYHNLGEAHRRLTHELKDSIYPLAFRKSMWSVLVQLWAEASWHQKNIKKQKSIFRVPMP